MKNIIMQNEFNMSEENRIDEEIPANENLMNDDDHARILIEEIISELISDLK